MSKLSNLNPQKAYELLLQIEKNYNKDKAQELLAYLNYQLSSLQEAELASTMLEGEGIIKVLHFLEYHETDKIHYMFDEFLEKLKETHDPYGPNFAAIHYFRGGGKTTSARAMIVKSMLKYPLRKRLIISSNLELASGMLMPIKLIMENNLKIRKYFGNKRGSTWNENELLLAEAAAMPNPDNSYSLEISSPQSKKTSKHYDEIYIDDPISLDDLGDGQKIKDACDAIEQAIPLLNPGGTMYCFGMRFGAGDIWDMAIYEHERAELFKDRTFVAGPFLASNEGEYLDADGNVVPENSEKKIPLYPLRFPVLSLERTRKAVGPAMWWSQYMNRPRTTSEKLMDYGKLSFMDNESWEKEMRDVKFKIIPRNQLRLIIDTANSSNNKSNMTSIELWRYDTVTFKLLFFRKLRFDFTHTVQYLADLAGELNLNMIYVEKSGVYDSIKNTVPVIAAKNNKSITVEGISHHGTNKNIRIAQMQPFLNQSLVLVAPPGTMNFPITTKPEDVPVSMHALLKHEMKIFPSDLKNPPDDLLDGFGHVPEAFGIDSAFFDMRLLKGSKMAEDMEDIGIKHEFSNPQDEMKDTMERLLEAADNRRDDDEDIFLF